MTSPRQSTATHISNHIHEWRQRRCLIKAMIPYQFLNVWFVKSLLPPIVWDVVMEGVTTEEEVISHAQYLDLVYSQYGVLYGIIKDAPRPSLDPSRPTSSSHVDGVIGTLKT